MAIAIPKRRPRGRRTGRARLSIDLPEETHYRLRKVAFGLDTTMTDIVVQALERALNDDERADAGRETDRTER